MLPILFTLSKLDMKPLDLLNTPLTGTHLIEANAGTGKTYTIEGLFLRLILEKNLSVDQILVVTFTKAATEELKDRIRLKIRQAKVAFESGTSTDPVIRKLLEKSDRPKRHYQQLNDALFDFDRASIFTIHGFCQHILVEHAFETGCLFDVELIADKAGQIREVSEDFWRDHVYNLPEELVSFIVNKTHDPSYFQRLIDKSIPPGTKIIPDAVHPNLSHLPPYRQYYGQLKAMWREAKAPVSDLLKDPALNGVSYGSIKQKQDKAVGEEQPHPTARELKVLKLVEAMDRFTDSQHIGFPLFEDFEKFTASYISLKTNKKKRSPSHPFFDACQALFTTGETLENEMASYLLFLKRSFYPYAASALSLQKKKQRVQFFDDLLLQVHQTLMAKDGLDFAEKIRHQYRAALIDEFQDTDPVQYDIFTTLFPGRDGLLFLIGDPKQAIYSFRGADIFSYIHATKHVASIYSLTENWRSSPELLAATNAFFSQAENPFIYDEIGFIPSKPGKASNQEAGDTAPCPSPMVIWFVSDKSQKPLSKASAFEQILGAVSEEVRRLIQGTKRSHDSFGSFNSVDPGDVAILVRTNRQARLINQALSDNHIPSVLCNAGNIFDSHEAMEIERVLLSISEPGNDRLFRLAMGTDIFGIGAEDMDMVHGEPEWWASRTADFKTYHTTWQQKGFMEMFRLLLTRESIGQRLLSFSDGERRMTNLLHLAEILHHACVTGQLGIWGLIKWLLEQRYSRNTDLEEHQLRLESDEHAVKIVTIHKSKGLEYPIVFCPFGWEDLMANNNEILYHDPDENNRLVLDLSPDRQKDSWSLYRKELLAENTRLLYVSLTRAKSCCYLVWGHLRSSGSSGLAYLLSDISPEGDGDVVARLEKEMAGKTSDSLLKQVRQLAGQSNGAIRIEPLDSDAMPFAVEERHGKTSPPEILFCRKFCGQIDRSWRIVSYSSMVSSGFSETEFPDHDEGAFRDRLNRDKFTDIKEKDLQNHLILPPMVPPFPKGPNAGNFFHSLFEHIDYTDIESEKSATLVRTTLAAYGFPEDWALPVIGMVKDVVSTSLSDLQPELMLSKIPGKDRINEMEFYFPINPVAPQALINLFKKHGGQNTAAAFQKESDSLTFSPTRGFMKGYVDLIFSYENRYFIVDWKSNDLGEDIQAYGIPQLTEVMKTEVYFLQYHLYTLALHQYLTCALPDYAYEKDFGGVLYLFIRGIRPSNGPDYGVFFDCPEPELIHAMGRYLIPGYSQ